MKKVEIKTFEVVMARDGEELLTLRVLGKNKMSIARVVRDFKDMFIPVGPAPKITITEAI